MIIKIEDAESFKQPGVTGKKYNISELLPDNSFVYGELEGEHGERVSTKVPRMYYILEGKGRFEIAGEVSEVGKGDLIIIPPETKYNYWAQDGLSKFILYMESH